MKRVLLLMAFVAAMSINGCKDDDSDPETPAKININGQWVGTGYQCPAGTDIPGEIISIAETNGTVIATKVTGDPCVPAGKVTFRGTYDEVAKLYNIKWITGTTSRPAYDSSSTGTLTILDKDNLTTTFSSNPSISFKRQ